MVTNNHGIVTNNPRYWTAGVEHTKSMVTMVRNAKEFVDDPKLELKLRQMQADIKKVIN